MIEWAYNTKSSLSAKISFAQIEKNRKKTGKNNTDIEQIRNRPDCGSLYESAQQDTDTPEYAVYFPALWPKIFKPATADIVPADHAAKSQNRHAKPENRLSQRKNRKCGKAESRAVLQGQNPGDGGSGDGKTQSCQAAENDGVPEYGTGADHSTFVGIPCFQCADGDSSCSHTGFV